MAIWRSIRRITSRPHRVVQAAGASGDCEGSGAQGLSIWSELPDEMLREILMRVEATEIRWPSRRSVVAVAGVCRSWRFLTRELVVVPEISGRLTFPISVKQPGPRDCLLQCFIKRDRSNQTYHLYLGLTDALTDDGKFLLAARKFHRPTCTEFIISLQANRVSRKSDGYLGKLRYLGEEKLSFFIRCYERIKRFNLFCRSNFIGTKFTVYEREQLQVCEKLRRSRSYGFDELKISPKFSSGDMPVAEVLYEMNGAAARGPRKMRCTMNTIPATATEAVGEGSKEKSFIPQTMGLPTYLSKSSTSRSFQNGFTQEYEPLVLKNKTPRWLANLGCWCLNFHGRVTVASVKNFQLEASAVDGSPAPQYDNVILQFGKVGKDLFTMDFRYPISAFQAFAISLSSFDTRIICD